MTFMDIIFANRLIAARKMAGLSLQALAERLEGTTISRQALHKYEQNQAFPNSQTLIALSRALNVPVDFFFDNPEVQVELSSVEFRKLKRLSASAETALKEKVTDWLNRFLTLEKLANEEKPLNNFSYQEIIRIPKDADNAAAQLRQAWGLGNDPIPNVAAMLEEHGYKVLLIDADTAFDGLKAFAGAVRVIVVNNNRDICRVRFTALHELAHHVLMFPEDMLEAERERLCHAFAGAVLLPSEQAIMAMNEHRFHFYLKELTLLKEYWGISIAAIFARAKNLGVINDYVFAKLNHGYRARHYHLNEPGHFACEEKTFRFNQLLYKALAEGVITHNQAAQLKNITLGELRENLEQLA